MRTTTPTHPAVGAGFAKKVFWAAGAWGVLTLTPMYFVIELLGRLNPPPISHPEFYFGFVGVALAWQFAFFAIGADPARFRPMIVPAILEKLGFVLAVAVLFIQGRLTLAQSTPAFADLLWCVLFIAAFLRLKHRDTAAEGG